MSILERTSWTDRSVDLLIHDIIEYDMRDGGLSIIKEDKLLPPNLIEKFSKMEKGIKRNAAIGKLRYKKEYADIPAKQNAAFTKYRLLFGEFNELEDEDILSIKKDAIFSKKYCYHLKIGQYIEFAEKHIYQAYLYIKVQDPKGTKNLEFYWSENGRLDVKGIDDKILDKYHRDYILKVIWRVLRYMVYFDKKGAIEYLVNFMDDYKMRRLPMEYYRTFNDDSIYPINFEGRQMVWTDVGKDQIHDIDISYNYIHIFTAILRVIASN